LVYMADRISKDAAFNHRHGTIPALAPIKTLLNGHAALPAIAWEGNEERLVSEIASHASVEDAMKTITVLGLSSADLASALCAIYVKLNENAPAAPPTLRAWHAQLAFWIPTLLLLILSGAASSLGLSDHVSLLGQALSVPWIIYGAGEVTTVISLAGFRDSFGNRVVATPSHFDSSNLILLAHEGIGHQVLGIKSEFLIRVLGPFLLAWALTRQIGLFLKSLSSKGNLQTSLLAVANAA
jgi:hypothetical protein